MASQIHRYPPVHPGTMVPRSCYRTKFGAAFEGHEVASVSAAIVVLAAAALEKAQNYRYHLRCGGCEVVAVEAG